MKAFRIGRKSAGTPWPNATPPIRGGVFKPLGRQEDEVIHPSPKECDTRQDIKVGLSDLGLSPIDSGVRSRVQPAAADHDAGKAPGEARESDDSNCLPSCPVEYTEWAVQQRINQCRQEYPCPDNTAVQQDIIRRYRQLHQQVKDEGLYECRYSEYGKEMIRYTSLFGLFLFALHHEWYMTSALFLGVFWVCTLLGRFAATD